MTDFELFGPLVSFQVYRTSPPDDEAFVLLFNCGYVNLFGVLLLLKIIYRDLTG